MTDEMQQTPAVITTPMKATKLTAMTSASLTHVAFDRPLSLKAGDQVFLPAALSPSSSVVVVDSEGVERETRRYQDGAYRFVVDGEVVTPKPELES